MTATLPAPLSRALQQSTQVAHDQAENATFVTRLMAGQGTALGLVALLRQSLPVYEALEQACRGASTDPRFAPLFDPALERTEALRSDLAVHAGAGRTYSELTPAVEAYIAELEASAAHPAALVGHHYVRYLGDLSGGQIIKAMVRRHYGIEEGLSFYEFTIDKPKVYKDNYRSALDALPLSDADRGSALAAATRAFELNHRIFLDLEAAGAR